MKTLAISVRPPFAWAIVGHWTPERVHVSGPGKPTENRYWMAAPSNIIGQTLLIHAAQGCEPDEYAEGCAFMRAIQEMPGGPWPKDLVRIPGLDEMPRGALVGRCRLADTVYTTDPHAHRHAMRGTMCSGPCLLCGGKELATLAAPCPAADPWAIPGAIGLVLADVRPLARPIPWRGKRGLFEVDEKELEAALRRWPEPENLKLF